MHVTRLRIGDLRRIERVEMAPGRGLNLLIGPNGAGKTSVLEALHLMAWGRSFRGRVRDGLIRSGASALEVYLEWQAGTDARAHRAGLRHTGSSWEARLDGDPVQQLGELFSELAVVTFEPGSHALLSAGGEPRRRFLDWGLFHVEPGFLTAWRRYARALRQRNALLKAGAAGAELDSWDSELASAGEPLTRVRATYLAQLEEGVARVAADLSPALGAASLEFLPGWRQADMPLEDALLLARDRDRLLGHTTVGPHRADWRIHFASMPNRETPSRGQAKLAALSCLLAQAGHYAGQRGEWPVVALDDLGSELDAGHRRRVLDALLASGAQVFVTGTEAPVATADAFPAVVFHVEQGQLTRA